MSSETELNSPRKQGNLTRKLVGVGLLIVFALVIAWGVNWWHDRLLRQSLAHLKNRRPEDSLRFIGYYLERNPKSSRALAIKARAFVDLGRPAEAIELFDEIGIDGVEDTLAAGQAYMLMENWSVAVAFLTRVLDLDPKNADAWFGLTTCYVQRGQYTDALNAVAEFTKTPGNAARGHVAAASIWTELQDMEETLHAYEQVVKLEPDGENLQIAPFALFTEYGRLLLLADRPQNSIPYLERGVKLQPNAEALVFLGNALASVGEHEKAREKWKQAVHLMPNNQNALVALANSDLQDNHPSEALEWLLPLTKETEITAATAFLFQRVYAIKGQQDEASKWQEIAEQLRQNEQRVFALGQLFSQSSDNVLSQLLRAYQFAAIGNWSEAEAILSARKSELPNDPFVKKLEEAINNKTTLPSLDAFPLKTF